MTAEEMVDGWYMFGLDPHIIVPDNGPGPTFSAAGYVRQRAPALCPTVPVVLPRPAS